jgi:hypothetical protein
LLFINGGSEGRQKKQPCEMAANSFYPSAKMINPDELSLPGDIA